MVGQILLTLALVFVLGYLGTIPFQSERYQAENKWDTVAGLCVIGGVLTFFAFLFFTIWGVIR